MAKFSVPSRIVAGRHNNVSPVKWACLEFSYLRRGYVEIEISWPEGQRIGGLDIEAVCGQFAVAVQGVNHVERAGYRHADCARAIEGDTADQRLHVGIARS